MSSTADSSEFSRQKRPTAGRGHSTSMACWALRGFRQNVRRAADTGYVPADAEGRAALLQSDAAIRFRAANGQRRPGV
jgi:hypothetical protein